MFRLSFTTPHRLLEMKLSYPYDARSAEWVRIASFDLAVVAAIDIHLRCISEGAEMQVAKWGNSLAVRLPAAVVDALDLKEGDQIEIRIVGARTFEVQRDPTRENALARLRKLRRPLPPGFVFDRDEANAR
jgi:antitoxin MazE